MQHPQLEQYRIKVLLIDDQPIVGETVRRMLVLEQDISFHYCSDPSQAMATAVELMPTILLQDLVMPDVDGLTLVKFYRAHPKLKDVPLIVLSSKEEAVTKAEAFAAGANDYLVKLPDRIELVARIRYHSQGYINLLQRNDAYAALLRSRETLARELQQAALYVSSLIPAPVKTGPVRTFWSYIPSSELGGDFFGYHWLDDDNFAIYLLDVCGHGVGSALLAVSVINMVQTASLQDVDFKQPDQVLSALNNAFQMERTNGLFFTIWYAVFDRRTKTLRYAAGGHHFALLIDRERQLHELQNCNMFIGGMMDITYQGAEVVVPEGARLYVFSDGVFEVAGPDGEMWGSSNLAAYLVAPLSEPSKPNKPSGPSGPSDPNSDPNSDTSPGDSSAGNGGHETAADATTVDAATTNAVAAKTAADTSVLDAEKKLIDEGQEIDRLYPMLLQRRGKQQLADDFSLLRVDFL